MRPTRTVPIYQGQEAWFVGQLDLDLAEAGVQRQSGSQHQHGTPSSAGAPGIDNSMNHVAFPLAPSEMLWHRVEMLRKHR